MISTVGTSDGAAADDMLRSVGAAVGYPVGEAKWLFLSDSLHSFL
jgi:hypothetical protein